MSKKVEVCEKDTYYLNKIQSEGFATSKSQPISYKNLVVLKPWGYEFLAFENEHVAIWFLHIKEGHSTSMHCHPQKKTTLAVLNGECFCHTFLTRNSLVPMDSIQIEKGVFHSTTAVSTEGIFLLELETPPNKTDLVRFNDKYGRSKEGYEPSSQMMDSNLEKFNFFHFDEAELTNEFTAGQFKVSLQQFESQEHFKENFRLQSGEKALICRGSVNWGDQHSMKVSEIFDNQDHAGLPLWISEPVTLFCLKRES